MGLKFTEEPFAWIGSRTWPWVQPHHQAKLWGKCVVLVLLPFSTLLAWHVL